MAGIESYGKTRVFEEVRAMENEAECSVGDETWDEELCAGTSHVENLAKSLCVVHSARSYCYRLYGTQPASYLSLYGQTKDLYYMVYAPRVEESINRRTLRPVAVPRGCLSTWSAGLLMMGHCYMRIKSERWLRNGHLGKK